MPVDLTISAGPIFASRSRINSESRDFGTFIASSMQAILERIIDGDPESFWHSAVGDDALPESIQASVQFRSAQVSQQVDIVAFQNINLKNFLLEYSADGGISFSTVPGFDFQVGVADNASPDIIKSFSPISIDTFRLSMFKTFVPNDLKRVGGIFACLSTLQLVTGGMSKYEKRFREEIRSLKMGQGNRSDELTLRSATSYEHWGAAVDIELATRAERDALRAIKRGGRPFVFIPEPFEVPRDIFTCLMEGSWSDSYMTSFTGSGYKIPLTLEEVGES